MQVLQIHKASWQEPETPGPDMLVYVAQRPLTGEHTWEGVNRYGIHYAAVSAGHSLQSEWHQMNQRNDARLIHLIDNEKGLGMAGELAAMRRSYGLADYLREMPGHEGAREFCRVYGLPWDDGDTSADAIIHAATDAAGAAE